MSDPQPILERLLQLHPKLIDLQLDRIERLLEDLGQPQRVMPPVIHVAGTNGKGSVVALLRATLEAAGYTVHVYTSPHLVRFNERIRVAGKVIDDEALSAVLAECEDTNAGQPITFFEITTAAAFLAFSRTPANVVLLETGLGGRFDATNVMPSALLCAITPVSLDHQQYLGQTLAEIAVEKAGILKPGVTAMIADQEPEAMDAIAQRAEAIGAPLRIEGLDWTLRFDGREMVVNVAGHIRSFPKPALEGPHQVRNAGLVVAALGRLPHFDVNDEAIALGFKTVHWPARLQRLRRGRIRAQLGQDFALWLDGGHNGAAGEFIAAWLDERERLPLHLVFGMLKTKDPNAFLAPLRPYIDTVRTVAIPDQGEAGFGADELSLVVRDAGFDAYPFDSVAQALRSIAAEEGVPARVVIAGSLYLAGSVLAESGAGLVESLEANQGENK